MAAVTLALVRTIGAVREQITVLEARIGEQLALHPDGAIFRSLPRSGSVRAATLSPRSVIAASGSRRRRHWPASRVRPRPRASPGSIVP
jgi:hypothetical protein